MCHARLLGPQDWQIYKSLHLQRLIEFGLEERLEQEGGYDDSHWQAEVAADNPVKKFALFHGREAIGGAVAALKPEKGSINYVGAFILPAYQGNNLAHILHDARNRFAIDQEGYTTITTDVADFNLRSQKAVERNGFKLVDTQPIPDHPRNVSINFFEMDMGDLKKRYAARPAAKATSSHRPGAG